MRQWKVDPRLLCRNHILGEHVECHMFVGTILRNKPLAGTRYIRDGLVEVHSIKSRHEELVSEMVRRGYNHKSPLPEFKSWHEGHVDSEANLIELARRCPECKKRIEGTNRR